MNNHIKQESDRQAVTAENRPPASNTGVMCKDFSYSIDWLSYSFSIESLQFHDAITGEAGYPQGFIPSHELFSAVSRVRPLPGYTQACELEAGRVDWHDLNLKQGGLLTLSGRDCQAARQAGVNFDSLLFHALSTGRNITRLDFAVDIFTPGVNPQDIETAWKDQRVDTSAKTAHPWPEYGKDGKLTGYTFYIGSGSSDAMLRVYDKGARERTDNDWIRIELQTRGKRAVALAKTMLASGIIAGGKAFLREFIQVNGVEWFTEACSGSEGEFLVGIEAKETDRQRWYKEQVFPAIDQDLKTGIGQWLRIGTQGLLDANKESEEHGGVVVSLGRKGRKFRGAIKVFESRGLGGGLMRLALMQSEENMLYGLIQDLGYQWDTKNQRWSLAGVVVPLADVVEESAGPVRLQASELPEIKSQRERIESINAKIRDWNRGVGG